MSTPPPAMIFAAGIGKRMRPLTAMTPKPLIEVAGKALIDHILDRLEGGGVGRFVVNVHYLADLVEVHVRRRLGESVRISDERGQLLDTGGGLMKALPALGDGPFILANADTFWIDGASNNIARLIAGFDPDRMDALLLCAPTVGAVGYRGPGDFALAPDGKIAWRNPRKNSPFVYAGCGIFSRAAIEGAPDGPFSMSWAFKRMIERDRLFGQRLDGLWLHVGTPNAVRAADAAYFSSVG